MRTASQSTVIKKMTSILFCLCIIVWGQGAYAQTKIEHTKYMFHHLEAGQTDALITYLKKRPKKDRPDLEPLFGLAAAYAEKGDIKTAIGLGFGVDVPRLGPVRIDYGYPLNPDDDQGSGRIHLMTGVRF